MRVQPGHSEARGFDPHLPQRGMRQPDDGEDAFFFNALAGHPQGYVSRNVGDAEVALRQHHGVIPGFGEIGVDFRVPGIVVAGSVDGGLVDGAGHGGIDVTRHGQLDHLGHVFEGGPALCGGNLLVPQLIQRQVFQVEHIDAAEGEPGLGNRLSSRHFQLQTAKAHGVGHDPGIADHDRPAHVIDFFQRQRLGADLRPDPGRVAHGYADDGQLRNPRW